MFSSDRASEFLLELYHDAAECTPNALRLRTLKNLQHLVPFDFAVWGGGVSDGRLVTELVVLDQSEAILGEWGAVANQDAFCDLTLNRLGTTARFDDVPDYRNSLAYNDHWRRFAASHMMATIVAEKSDGHVSFVGLCADDRPFEFSESERDFKQAIMPHLSQALRINRQLWTGHAAAAHEAVALVDGDGWILSSQGPFGDFAEAEWGKRINRIPTSVMGKLLHRMEWRGQALDARLAPFEGHYFVHFTSQPILSRLSERERQVAEFFAAGMTHKEVARVLGTAPSTVRNQIVRIYEKLGIANKAALVAIVRRA